MPRRYIRDAAGLGFQLELHLGQAPETLCDQA